MPTHTLHQQVDPHVGRKNHYPILACDFSHPLHNCMGRFHSPTLPSLFISRRDILLPHAPFGGFSIVFPSHAESWGVQIRPLAFWAGECIFPYRLWSVRMFFHRQGLRICLPFHFGRCTFPVASLLRVGCCFSGVLLALGSAMLWGLYVSLLIRLSHDRANNKSGIDFPCPSCE